MALPHQPPNTDGEPINYAAVEDHQLAAASRLRDVVRDEDGLHAPAPQPPPPGAPPGSGRLPDVTTLSPLTTDDAANPLGDSLPSPHHQPGCAGCRDTQFRLDMTRRSLSSYIADGARAHSDLTELRRGIITHLTRRHPDRVDELARRRQSLTDATANDTLLFLVQRWDDERDKSLVDNAVATLRRDLAAAHADLAALRVESGTHHGELNAQRQQFVERLDRLDAALQAKDVELGAARRRLSETQAFAADIVQRLLGAGGKVPTMPNHLEYYTGSTRGGQHVMFDAPTRGRGKQSVRRDSAAPPQPRPPTSEPVDNPSPPPSTSAGVANRAGAPRPPRPQRARAATASDEQPAWRDEALRAIHAGTCWHRRLLPAAAGTATAETVAAILLAWKDQGLVDLRDREHSCALLPGPSLAAALNLSGPAQPSPLAQVDDELATHGNAVRALFIRALVIADLLYDKVEVKPTPDALPLIGARERMRGEVVWVVPWLPAAPGLVTATIRTAHATHRSAAVVVVVRRAELAPDALDAAYDAADLPAPLRHQVFAEDVLT